MSTCKHPALDYADSMVGELGDAMDAIDEITRMVIAGRVDDDDADAAALDALTSLHKLRVHVDSLRGMAGSVLRDAGEETEVADG